MDTGYPALIADPPLTPLEPRPLKTSGGLVPNENPLNSTSSEQTAAPSTTTNAS